MKRIAIVTVCASLLTQGLAFAHETGNHHMDHKADTQMEKLHKIMPMYAQAQVMINEALEKGDAAAVESETGKILRSVPDLKKSKPHKNLKQLATFRKTVSAFERDVKKTASLAKTGDLAGAKAAFRAAQKRCDECHAKFRD